MIVVKHSYISARDRQSQVGGKPSKAAAMGRALAHIKYIQHRPGEDRGEGGREFFNDSDDELSARRLRKAIREMKDAKVVVHKITLAPEINPEDKRAFTREVMKQLGAEKGQDLRWVAVEHNNTNHHHIHVVVFGKDKNGKDVRIDKKDYPKIKDYGDKFLERFHPLELERSRSERERKEKERMQQRQKAKENAKQERIRDGLELPWMHKKIIREQLEPFKEWKNKPKAKAAERLATADKDLPVTWDKIEAADKIWTKQNSLAELEALNRHLWDHHEDRIDPKDYKKLVAWMHEKRDLEQAGRAYEQGDKAEKQAKKEKELKDYFEYKGERYSESSSYEKLSGLTAKLRDKGAERLPFEEYNQLRGWLEKADRAQWSGVVNKQIELSKYQWSVEGAQSVSPKRAVSPISPTTRAIMANPVMGLFWPIASIANRLVQAIDIRDNKDRLKEGRDSLEEAKRDKVQQHNQSGRPEKRKSDDREAIKKLDKAIDENKATRDKAVDDKKKKRNDRPSEEDPFTFDPWGRY